MVDGLSFCNPRGVELKASGSLFCHDFQRHIAVLACCFSLFFCSSASRKAMKSEADGDLPLYFLGINSSISSARP